MTPLAALDSTLNTSAVDLKKNPDFEALYSELEKGVQSMKNGEVFTIEDAWEKIDRI